MECKLWKKAGTDPIKSATGHTVIKLTIQVLVHWFVKLLPHLNVGFLYLMSCDVFHLDKVSNLEIKNISLLSY